jgi:GDP-L-fucose synthase
MLENYSSSVIMNTGSTEENSIKDIAYMVADNLSIERERIFFNTEKPSGIHKKSTDNSIFIKESKFVYTPFKEGLKKTIEWFDQTYKTDKTKIKLNKKV